LNNKLTAKPTVKKSIFESKTPRKEQDKSQVYNYGTFKNSIYSVF
jgi:hypothetical protein